MYEGDWKNDEQEGKYTYADGGVFEGDWKNDGREGGQEHVNVRRRVRVRGRLQERQDGGQVHVHRRGRVHGRLEERRAQEEGSQVEHEDVERKRKAAKSGSRRTPTGTCTRATSRTTRWRASARTPTGARTRATMHRRTSGARGRQPSK